MDPVGEYEIPRLSVLVTIDEHGQFGYAIRCWRFAKDPFELVVIAFNFC